MDCVAVLQYFYYDIRRYVNFTANRTAAVNTSSPPQPLSILVHFCQLPLHPLLQGSPQPLSSVKTTFISNKWTAIHHSDYVIPVITACEDHVQIKQVDTSRRRLRYQVVMNRHIYDAGLILFHRIDSTDSPLSLTT